MFTQKKSPVEQLKEDREAERLKIYNEFLRLAYDLARGETVDTGSVKVVLNMSGKSFNDLDEEIERMKTRINMSNELKQRPEDEKTLVRLQAEHQRLTEEYNRVCLPIIQQLGPALERMRMMEASMTKYIFIESQLESHCRHEVHDARIKEIQQQMKELGERRQELECDASRLRYKNQSDDYAMQWTTNEIASIDKQSQPLREELDERRKLRKEWPR